MTKLIQKRGTMTKFMALALLAVATVMFVCFNEGVTVFAAQATNAANAQTGATNLSDVTSPIIGLLKSILNVLIPLVAAVGTIYCVLLGVKFARAEEPQDREKAKQHLRNAIIGFVLIFILIVALTRAEPILSSWMVQNMKSIQ